MNRQILIISSSPRKGGNSDTLCEEFMKGCVEAGHDVEKINLREHKINFCKACYVCKKAGAWQLGDIQGNPAMQEATRWAKIFAD